MESLYINKTTELIEYMNLHLISLEQDYDKFPDGDKDSIIHLNGQILATRHLMSVAADILGIKLKENNA